MTDRHGLRCPSGFTLIELIIFIVVVSAGLAGILSVMNSTIKASADPMVRKQQIAVAESLLEEIVLKDYCDPDTVDRTTNPPTCPARTASEQEASRHLFDDVDDYTSYGTSTGIVAPDVAATPVSGLESYNISPTVAVDTVTLNGLTVKKITVSVSHGSDIIGLTGYRANY